jgi:L-amino acid N-acyltransferase YncA
VNDAESILAIYGPICESSSISFETQSPSLSEMRQRIEKTTLFFPWLVVADSKDVLGYAYAGPHRERSAYRWSTDVTVYLHQDARRKGIGTALYTAILELLRIQGFHRAYAGIALPNPGSVRLHEKMGFRSIGIYHGVGYKLGTWHDVQWMEATLRSGNEDPQDPISVDQIDSAKWRTTISDGEKVLGQVAF